MAATRDEENGRIDCYIDCVSPYSYFAVLHLLRNRAALASQGVVIEFHPVFLGGIMQGSGNKPPWTFAPRAAYLQHDRPRAMNHFNLPRMKAPKDFPVNTIQAQRALTYIKATHGAEKFEETLMKCFEATWQNQEDLGSPDVVRTVFARVFGSATELDAIMEASAQAEWKKALTEKTKEALERGAYGAPWFWVRNCRRGEEREGPFFGSDRFAFMWEFLGLRWRDVEIEHLGTGGGAKL